jgi:hypothetical protein
VATPGERINQKKRIIAALLNETWGDTELIFDEFEVPDLSSYNANDLEGYVRKRLGKADATMLAQMDYYLRQKPASDEIPNQEPPPMSSLLEGQENTLFSEDEQDRIARLVDQLKSQARESYALPAPELQGLEDKLDYLCEASSRVGRVDWLNLALGAIVGKFADVVLSSDVAHKVLTALGVGLGPLFGHPVPLLGP